MIDLLIKRNQELIIKYARCEEKLNKQLMISKFLQNKNCFFDIKIEDAFNILNDLEFENIKDTYIELISYNNYIKM